MPVGTCFGCGGRKAAAATLLVPQRHEVLALCPDCLRAAPGDLARLTRRLRDYLTACYGADMTFQLRCTASLRSLTILLATLHELALTEDRPERRS